MGAGLPTAFRAYVSSHLLPSTDTVITFLELRVPLKGVPVVKVPAALNRPAEGVDEG
jgi:hypothetical protein